MIPMAFWKNCRMKDAHDSNPTGARLLKTTNNDDIGIFAKWIGEHKFSDPWMPLAQVWQQWKLPEAITRTCGLWLNERVTHISWCRPLTYLHWRRKWSPQFKTFQDIQNAPRTKPLRWTRIPQATIFDSKVFSSFFALHEILWNAPPVPKEVWSLCIGFHCHAVAAPTNGFIAPVLTVRWWVDPSAEAISMMHMIPPTGKMM